jgi:flagellar basal body rod protein FlgC
MTAATRAYEANINVLNTTKEMLIKSLDLIK